MSIAATAHHFLFPPHAAQVLQSGTTTSLPSFSSSSSNTNVTSLPPPTLNESRLCLGDIYRLLSTIARIQGKAKREKVPFAEVVPKPGWVEGNMANVEMLLMRFEKREEEGERERATSLQGLVRRKGGDGGAGAAGV